ncbi:hypothetical protein [Saccharomonospora iraqiensis]|uniref:hypothetical protein n=1 Tax=Saccharomonospora iraqiensis TaxID=52698 RepID=UPI00022E004B|nr:hypothetical protein [Saccharomonospora iraqiensis]
MTGVDVRAPRWSARFGPRARKSALVVHIVTAGAWIGIDVVLAVLVFTALTTDDVDTAAVSYQALELFALWPLFLTGLACLVSGLVLGAGTRYGVVRYWWVVGKLVINVVFVALVPLALRPAVTEAAGYGRAMPTARPAPEALSDLIFPPIVSPLGLLAAVSLAVFKPWGRVRPRRH